LASFGLPSTAAKHINRKAGSLIVKRKSKIVGISAVAYSKRQSNQLMCESMKPLAMNNSPINKMSGA